MVSLRFLLDTDALSEPLKPKPHPGFMRKIHLHTGGLAIASTTWHEALFGLHRMSAGKRQQEVRDYLFDVVGASVPILPYDDAAAEWHAQERGRLAGLGHAAPFADGQVAAVAKVQGLVLVTANVKDFARFEGITVENWRR